MKNSLRSASNLDLSRRRFLSRSAATAMGVVASTGQTMAIDDGRSSDSLGEKKHSRELREKAEKVELFLRHHFLDSNNIVFTHLDKKTLKPPGESFFPEIDSKMSIMDYHIEGYTRSGIAAYENCGMTTGAYMQSLLYQYKVEKNAAILQKVRKCYYGIKYIYEIGKQLEEGFFPKIYGNKFSQQTSSDQVLYVVSALDHFSEYADREEQKEIGNMIYQLVNFWMKRDYKFTYYNTEDMQWPLTRFPTLLILSYKHTGDEKFKKEYDRLLSEGYAQKPEWALLHEKKNGIKPLSAYEKKKGAYLIMNMADFLTMDVMNFDILLKNDPKNPLSEKWRKGVLQMWEEAEMTILPNGKYYSQALVDFETGAVSRTGGYQKGESYHGSESGWSTMVSRGAAMAYKYYPENKEIVSKVSLILESIDINDMTYYDEPERWAPRYRFKTKFLSGDSISNWLWTYWLARHLDML